ncbi:beta strand repeat-containing protein, partial [Halomonas sp.]|uniref:beta strand repeat-containing protein n=1 Tax=Halomonas sp. TaxID=1486246 RepID=UPI0035646C08
MLVAADAQLADGVAEADVTRTTANDDTIEGVASALSSARTLNAGDQIDGGAGNDTLQVDMQGTFNGFTADGGVTNVETIALSNSGSIARTFNATGVEGDVNYVVNAGDATVNLSNVGSLAGTVELNGQASGNVTIGYATGVTSGSSDTLNLSLDNVGTVAEGSTPEAAVGITAAGVENATLAATGANVVDLSSVAATTYTTEGDGSLKVTNLATGLKGFDASAMTGDLNLTVNATTATKNATIAGGEGDDSVTLIGGGTVQYAMSGVETLNLGNNTTALTYSAKNTSGVENIVATSGFQDATFASLGNTDIALTLEDGASNAIILDNAGSTTVTVADPDATTASPGSASAKATLTKATSATVNVAQNMTYSGTIVANQADSVIVAAAGTLGTSTTSAAIQAGNATSIQINEVAKDSSLNITAAKAQQLNVEAAANLDLS